jgi:ribosomal protein S27AE
MDLKCPNCGLFMAGMSDSIMLESEEASYRCPNCGQNSLLADYLLKPKAGAQVSISKGDFALVVCAPDRDVALDGLMGCGSANRGVGNVVALQPHAMKDCFWVSIISRDCVPPGPAVIRFRQGKFEVVSCRGEISGQSKERPRYPLAQGDPPPPGWPTKEDMAGEQRNTKEMAEYADQQKQRAEKAEAELDQLRKDYCSLSIRANGEDRQKINDLTNELAGARERAENAERQLAKARREVVDAQGGCSLLDARWQKQYDELEQRCKSLNAKLSDYSIQMQADQLSLQTLRQSHGREAELLDRLANSQKALAEERELNQKYFERATKAENELAVWHKDYGSLPAAAMHETELLQKISLLEQANARERDIVRELAQHLVNLCRSVRVLLGKHTDSEELRQSHADLDSKNKAAIATIARLKNEFKEHNVVGLEPDIQIVSAGVDPNHQTHYCDYCGHVFEGEDVIRTCTREKHVTLCEKCYKAAENTVR